MAPASIITTTNTSSTQTQPPLQQTQRHAPTVRLPQAQHDNLPITVTAPNIAPAVVQPEEHLNFWVKVSLVTESLNKLTLRMQNAYKAHGSNASWDWLDTLAPMIEVLRNTAQNFNDTLGADQGTQHTPPDSTNDIVALMESLNENSVLSPS